MDHPMLAQIALTLCFLFYCARLRFLVNDLTRKLNEKLEEQTRMTAAAVAEMDTWKTAWEELVSHTKSLHYNPPLRIDQVAQHPTPEAIQKNIMQTKEYQGKLQSTIKDLEDKGAFVKDDTPFDYGDQDAKLDVLYPKEERNG